MKNSTDFSKSSFRSALCVMFPAVGIWLVLGICLISVCARADESNNQVVAKIGDREITEQEIEKLIRPRLVSVENEIYEIKREAILSLADDYVLEKAARQAHMTKEQYLQKMVNEKLKPISDDEARAYYEAHKVEIGQPYDKVKGAIVKYLERKQAEDLRENLLESLRKENGFKLLLAAPRSDVASDRFPSLGPQDAPVTIVEFTDFQCPFCRRAQPTVKALLDKYDGKIRFVHRDFPLSFHRNAMKAAIAAHCAGDQGRFWQYHDALFASQSKLSVDDLKALAKKLGLDEAKFNHCLDSDEHAEEIKRDLEEGEAVGVEGTPTFFINGISLVGAQPIDKFESVIDSELAHSQAAQANHGSAGTGVKN